MLISAICLLKALPEELGVLPREQLCAYSPRAAVTCELFQFVAERRSEQDETLASDNQHYGTDSSASDAGSKLRSISGPATAMATPASRAGVGGGSDCGCGQALRFRSDDLIHISSDCAEHLELPRLVASGSGLGRHRIRRRRAILAGDVEVRTQRSASSSRAHDCSSARVTEGEGRFLRGDDISLPKWESALSGVFTSGGQCGD